MDRDVGLRTGVVSTATSMCGDHQVEQLSRHDGSYQGKEDAFISAFEGTFETPALIVSGRRSAVAPKDPRTPSAHSGILVTSITATVYKHRVRGSVAGQDELGSSCPLLFAATPAK